MFRACENVEMCFYLIKKICRARKIIRNLTIYVLSMLFAAKKQSKNVSFKVMIGVHPLLIHVRPLLIHVQPPPNLRPLIKSRDIALQI